MKVLSTTWICQKTTSPPRARCLPAGLRSAFSTANTSKRPHHLWQHGSVKGHLATPSHNMGNTQGLKKLHLQKFLHPALKWGINATKQSQWYTQGAKPKKSPTFTQHQREMCTNPQHLFRLLWQKVPGVTALNVQNEEGTLYTQCNFVYVMQDHRRVLAPL